MVMTTKKLACDHLSSKVAANTKPPQTRSIGKRLKTIILGFLLYEIDFLINIDAN